MAIVHVDGVDLKVNRYRLDGGPEHRPVVVFVHGLGIVDHSGLSFTVGIPLATDNDVVLYALRGHGRSQLAPTGYRLADHVGDLVALVDALGIVEPVHVVGCSYGGAIATVAAMNHPERVASIFLLDPVVPVTGWTGPIRSTLDAVADRLQGEISAEEAMAALGITSRRKAVAVADRARRLLLGTSLLVDLRREQAFGPTDFARLRSPVTAVFGADSDMYPLAETLRDAVPSATIHTIPGADHLQVFGHTREIIAWIRQHLASLQRASAGRES